ncbi:hypothetical protein HYS91_05455 [Candidatus Daviesbacteria bacterium]|nr:hypothetical protein [Candidatus Daviesbacteria bacterium]
MGLEASIHSLYGESGGELDYLACLTLNPNDLYLLTSQIDLRLLKKRNQDFNPITVIRPSIVVTGIGVDGIRHYKSAVIERKEVVILDIKDSRTYLFSDQYGLYLKPKEEFQVCMGDRFELS